MAGKAEEQYGRPDDFLPLENEHLGIRRGYLHQWR